MHFTAGLGAMVVVVAIGFLDCNNVGLAIMLVVLETGVFGAANRAGAYITEIDMAPRYSLHCY